MNPERVRKVSFRSGLVFLRAALWSGAVTLVLAVGAVLWINNQADLMQERVQQQTGQLLVNGLSNALINALIARDYASLEARLVQTMADDQVVSAMVLDLEGRLLSRVQRNPQSGIPEPLFDQNVLPLPQTAEEHFTIRQGQLLTVWHRIEPGIGLGWLQVVIMPSQLSSLFDQTIHQMTLITVGIALIVLMVLGVVFTQTHGLVKAREIDLLEGQQRLEVVASQDPVTGLPNRRSLMERLAWSLGQHRQHPHSLVVTYLDLDGFKQINDTQGHEAGDHVLVEVAHRLLAAVRHGDTVSRMGGDEFVLLLENVESQAIAEDILRRVVNEIQQPISYQDASLVVTTSIGLARYPEDGQSAQSLLKRADLAMYRAKQAGKNCWMWYQIPEIA